MKKLLDALDRIERKLDELEEQLPKKMEAIILKHQKKPIRRKKSGQNKEDS